jgi:hypothetical protein
VEPGETFTDEEMIVALARAIEDLIFKEIYGFNIPYEVRLVLDTLAYASRRLPVIKHSKKIKPTKGKVTKGILRKMVADAIDKSRATAGKRIDWAIAKELFNEVRWHDQRTVRVLSFDREQKRKYLTARQLALFETARIALEQRKDPSNPEAGRTEANSAYYMNIIKMINRPPEPEEKQELQMKRSDKCIGDLDQHGPMYLASSSQRDSGCSTTAQGPRRWLT